MSNKKSFMHWEILLVALFVSIGILYLPTRSVDIPKVGEFSIDMIKSLEKGGNIPIIIQNIMKHLNKEANITYENHQIFGLDSYCNNGTGLDDSGYKERLIEEGREFDPINTITKRDPIKCYADEKELMKYYEEAFGVEYDDFRSTELENLDLDFSSIDYIPEVVNEGTEEEPNYFIKLITENGFTLPITTDAGREEKNIGSFTIKPNFKLKVPNPPNKPFNSAEICIFASVCGATCHDALEINPGSDFKLKEDVSGFGCDAYHLCTTPLDQFDEEFSCSKENEGDPNNPILCRGQCLAFCSVSSGRVEDEDTSTQCNEFSCSRYMECSDFNPNPATCGCPDPANPSHTNTCTGNECDILHCERDPSIVGGGNTHCRSLTCTDYNDCNSVTLSCDCDTGNECSGSCPLCWTSTWTIGSTCGESNAFISCNQFSKLKTRTVKPSSCDTAFDCTACDPSCDTTCGCVTGPNCGPCGVDPRNECGGCGIPNLNECGLCPGEPCPEPVPTPPAPAGDSCEGREGQFDPDASCQCDIACSDPLFDDCCDDA